MPLLLAPVLAQLVTLNLGARTEARYVDPAGEHYQEETRPLVGLSSRWEHESLTLTYAPSLLLTRFENPPVELVVFHTAALTFSFRLRHVTVTLGDAGTYGQIDPSTQALGAGAGLNQPVGAPPFGTGTGTGTGAGPGTGIGTPPGTGTGVVQPLALQRVYSLASATSSAGVAYEASALDTLSLDSAYVISSGTDAASRIPYPLFEAIRLAAGWRRRLTPVDNLSSLVSSTYGWGAGGAAAFASTAAESWMHVFDPQTQGRLGAGVAFTHQTQTGAGGGNNAVYPTADAAITHATELARGILGLTAGVSFTPLIDPRTATVDPSLGLFAGIAWTKDGFSTALTGNASVALEGSDKAGAQDLVGGAFRVAYRLGRAVSVDTGVRGAWQVYQGQTVIPPTYAAFVGISFGAQLPLNHG